MLKWPIITTVLAVALVAGVGCRAPVEQPAVGVRTRLHDEAEAGHLQAVAPAIAEGADPNARDESGRTPMHLSAYHGHEGTTQALLDGGADPNARDLAGKTALDYARERGSVPTIAVLEPVTDRSYVAPPPPPRPDGTRLNPGLRYMDEAAFAAGIGEPAVVLKSEHVLFFAPRRLEQSAGIIYPYLTQAYEELHRLTGMYTEYAIVVYSFPAGSSEAFGGTSNCVLYYDEERLWLDRQEEWTQYHVPHVSGYIEEMAHNFVSSARVQFGWEMVGWSLGVIATEGVAGNPAFRASLQRTRQGQAETFQRYTQLGHRLPDDVPPNLVDRIHAYLLHQCEQRYGPRFWPDFFAEVDKDYAAFAEAAAQSGDPGRNRRYQLSIACFDRLPGLEFSRMLSENGISLTTDVKSLHPTEAGWDRRLVAPGEL